MTFPGSRGLKQRQFKLPGPKFQRPPRVVFLRCAYRAEHSLVHGVRLVRRDACHIRSENSHMIEPDGDKAGHVQRQG